MYSRLKDEVFDRLMAVLRPIQEKRRELAASGVIGDVLADGANRARAIASQTMTDVRKRVGLGSSS
jgi:tryptophanyl-tRNA synthetase